jgi:hypothetical protein
MKNNHYNKIKSTFKDFNNIELNLLLAMYIIFKLSETKSVFFFTSLIVYVPFFIFLPTIVTFTLPIVLFCLIGHLISWFLILESMVNEEKRDNDIIPSIQAIKDLIEENKQNSKK